jgi:hypothetical protein
VATATRDQRETRTIGCCAPFCVEAPGVRDCSTCPFAVNLASLREVRGLFLRDVPCGVHLQPEPA